MPKNIPLNSTHYFIIKMFKKHEFQQITFNNSSVIDFMNLYKNVLQNHIIL